MPVCFEKVFPAFWLGAAGFGFIGDTSWNEFSLGSSSGARQLAWGVHMHE
jgi:hypothetical protein